MRPFSLVLLALLASTRAFAAPTLGFIERFNPGDFVSWGGGATETNPLGGADGPSDGYLLVTRSGFAAQLATRSDGLEYHGDWIAANINKINLCLNDVGGDQNLEIHVVVGNSGNFWLCKTGFAPPENAWALFSVDLTDSTNFTKIINLDGLGFSAALRQADRLHIRHDTAPFQMAADNILGEFGIDNIELTNKFIGVEPLPPGGLRPIELSAPYPNPARGAVACSFDVSDAAPVRIAIVDAAGRLVRAETLPGTAPGRRTWMWDGLDANGRLAPSGVYRVRVTGPAGGTSRPFVRVN